MKYTAITDGGKYGVQPTMESPNYERDRPNAIEYKKKYNAHLLTLPRYLRTQGLELLPDGSELIEGVDFVFGDETKYMVPAVCPITKRPFFMEIQHPELGIVPTYGGPFDSYTIPVKDEDDEDGGYWNRRYDHDEGAWVEDESTPSNLVVLAPLVKDQDEPSRLNEIVGKWPGDEPVEEILKGVKDEALKDEPVEQEGEAILVEARKRYPIDETYKKRGEDIQYLKRQAFYAGAKWAQSLKQSDAVENLCKRVQELFDAKKENPRNVGNGKHQAWNNLANALWDCNKLFTLK